MKEKWIFKCKIGKTVQTERDMFCRPLEAEAEPQRMFCHCGSAEKVEIEQEKVREKYRNCPKYRFDCHA